LINVKSISLPRDAGRAVPVLGITHLLRIYATTKLLKSHEWIAVRSGKHKAMPNRMQVRLDKLPLSGDLRRTIVSDEMKQMALYVNTSQGLRLITPTL
jgi:hypothetical protein